jgi:hypothetical protein
MSDADRLKHFEDVQQIINLKARYVEAADGGWTGKPPHDADGVRDLFVPDGVWNAGDFGGGQGHEGIHAYFAAAGEDTPMVFHQTGSPEVHIDGDRARGSWHVMVPMVQTGISRMLVGIYNDTFVRTPKGWKIERLEFTPCAMIDLPGEWKLF